MSNYVLLNGCFYKVEEVARYNELCHYGVKGMKWGVRKDRINDHVKIGVQFFAKNASSCKTIKLSTKEYAHVMSELMTNITEAQKKHPTVIKLIGNFMYTFENNFDGTYRVIGKKKNPGITASMMKGRKR